MARVTRPLPDPIVEARRQWVAHGWSDAAAGMTAVTSVMRAHQLLLARVEEALKPWGLSFARYELLTLLSFTREGGMPLTSAARRLQVHQTSATHTVDRLEASGFVRREPHPTDGRATLVTLTPEGRDVVASATTALNTEVFTHLGIDEADVESLISVIARLRAASGDVVD
ncbi:MarR family winged helix-turn-helix transcriptional regulator [Microbacterium sp.]|uniref:MarR family winged helix-turn-helix transcriptional regulator n=1 Tax=Microbacterium sp. TaxID=51671 RepID=UPI0039E435D2